MFKSAFGRAEFEQGVMLEGMDDGGLQFLRSSCEEEQIAANLLLSRVQQFLKWTRQGVGPSEFKPRRSLISRQQNWMSLRRAIELGGGGLSGASFLGLRTHNAKLGIFRI